MKREYQHLDSNSEIGGGSGGTNEIDFEQELEK